MAKKSTLDKVRAALADKKGGELDALSKATDVSYDTLLRIRDRPEYSPAFDKVERLARRLKVS